MNLKITENYIWLPAASDCDEVKLHIYFQEAKIGEIDVKLSLEPDFYFPMNVSEFVAKELEICSECDESLLKAISCHDDIYKTEYPYRPRIHFTTKSGWINDPNGLIYDNGIYHMFYQFNPYGIDWGNMHWGHAVSKDLISWELRDIALFPDEYGTVFSGCAFKDEKNASGYGKDALLFFYTAAGGFNKWSKNRGSTQRVAVSYDNGKTLIKKDMILDTIKEGNRDPKVFYHGESTSYVMVLYLIDNEFAILRSDDLKNWKESDRLSFDGMWECPDLFELETKDKDEKRWVFWSADGYYVLGDFDGYRFSKESEVYSAYDTKLPYAAQTYAGTDRRISVAWYRTVNDRGAFKGMMSIPNELNLVHTDNGLRIGFKPVQELFDLSEKIRVSQDASFYEKLSGDPVLIMIEWKGDESSPVFIGDIKIDKKAATILIDHGIIEYYSKDGTVYGALEAGEDILSQSIRIEAGIKSIEIRKIV